jgi:hypothetical protein
VDPLQQALPGRRHPRHQRSEHLPQWRRRRRPPLRVLPCLCLLFGGSGRPGPAVLADLDSRRPRGRYSLQIQQNRHLGVDPRAESKCTRFGGERGQTDQAKEGPMGASTPSLRGCGASA